MSRAIDLDTIFDGIWTWIQGQSGLAADHVLWAEHVEKNLITPPSDGTMWISLRPRLIDSAGRDWLRKAVDPTAWKVVTADPATDELALTAHGYATGQGAFRVSNTGGALPGGLAEPTPYWLIVVDADHFKLATSKANALANIPVDVTDAGTGTQKIVQVGTEIKARVAGPRRVHLEVRAFGGDLADATGTLVDVATGYRLPSVAAALREAGVGVGPSEGVRAVDGFVGAARVFEARAEWDVTLHVVAQLVETETYIERVNVTGTVVGPPITITGTTPVLP